MSSGALQVPEALCDTGPVLHLHEIARTDALEVFDRIALPERVAWELERLGLDPHSILSTTRGPELIVRPVPDELLGDHADGDLLQPADRQVLALARQAGYQIPVLTDDLALRERVERSGGVAVGTVGLLVRSFGLGRSTRAQLEESVDRLMTRSTLHMSRPFRQYVMDLIRELVDR